MFKTTSTKRALIASLISLVLCFSMLLGTTYAWFTDTVASAGNIIRSGILDADLVDADGNSLEGKTLEFQKADGAPDGEKVLWEPGCTYNLQTVYVANKGNLAFKYKIYITGIDGDEKLLEAIDWTVSNPDTNEVYDLDQWYHLKPGEQKSAPIMLSGHMREDAGNEYQDLVARGVSIMIYAIQDTVEFDSFDNQYDAMADVPTAKVNNIPVTTDPIYNVFNINNIIAGAKLDIAYKFSATEDGQDSPYANWHADFVIKADRDVADGSAVLAGKYDRPGYPQYSGKWFGATNAGVVAAGQEIRLLKDCGNVSVNYLEVCEFGDFFCGVGDMTGVNAGTKITVELRLYEATGATLDTETGKFITVQTTEYVIGTESINTVDKLTAAIAEGGTVVVDNDLVTNTKIEIPAGKDVVLNLNGHTIAGAFNENGGSALIENKGNLTITNGTIVSLAEYPDVDWGNEGFPTYATNTISNRGTLVIGDGAYIENKTAQGGASYAIDNYSGATVTINDGIIRAKDVAIRQFVTSTDAANDVTINGGFILGKRAVWVQLAGGDATKAPIANLTVNGGSLNSNVVDGSGNVIYSYSYGNSFANTNITITGGEFLDGQVAFGGGYKGDTETVTITGGKFEQDVIRYVADGDPVVLYTKN